MESNNNESFSMILKKHIQCVTHQLLRGLNLSSECHEFERENALYFDMDYFEDLIRQGAWNELEHYLGGFTTFQSNDFSKKLFFEIRKQKYLEAIDRGDPDHANVILDMDLSPIISDDVPLIHEFYSLQSLDNLRTHPHLHHWTDATTSRNILIDQLPNVITANPDLSNKLILPQAAKTKLVALARQSFEAQSVTYQFPGHFQSLLGNYQFPPQYGASLLINPTHHQLIHPSTLKYPRTDLEAGPSRLAAPAPVFLEGAGPQLALAEAAALGGRQTVTIPALGPDPNTRTALVTPPAAPLERASAGRTARRTTVEAAASVPSPPSAPLERASAGATRRRAPAARTAASRPPRAPVNTDAPLPLSLGRESAGASLGVAVAARTPLRRRASARTAPETSAVVPSSSAFPFVEEPRSNSSRDGVGSRRGKRVRVEENDDSPAVASTSAPPVSLSTAELPGPLARTLEQGSKARSLDFNPVHHTLLLVGTETAEVTLWDVRDGKEKLFSRRFEIWSQRAGLERLKADLEEDEDMSVNQVRWSQDGSLAGVAFTKGLIQLFRFNGQNRLRPHLQIEAHLSDVNDLAFTKWGGRNVFVTGGDDELVNVFDATSGHLLKSFEGHEASVLCVSPCQRGDQNYLFSTSLEGKLKVWSFDGEEAIFERDIQGGRFASVQHSADGSRLFACAVGRRGKCVVAELDEEADYKVKKKYSGLDKPVDGKVHFHTVRNQYLAVGHESVVKYWDMDQSEMLPLPADAAGGLETNPVVRFNKDGSLLAATAENNRIKILVGGVTGVIVLNGLDTGTPLSAQAGAMRAPPPRLALGMDEFEIGSSSRGGAGSKAPARTGRRCGPGRRLVLY